MTSVTQRIREIKQPRGGYIKPKDFEKIEFENSEELHEEENIHSSLIGLAVDYMTRYMNGRDAREAFKISLKGAQIINEEEFATSLINGITGLDSISIVNACRLAGFDVCFRAGIIGYKDVRAIKPDRNTIENIRMMIKRSLKFIESYGPIILDGFTFNGGYTNFISSGDGDFLTEETLWDFKVSKGNITSKHTLQLLIYYLMGLHSIHEDEFKALKSIGVFNPRLNIVYILEVNKISEKIKDEVLKYIIGYSEEEDRSPKKMKSLSKPLNKKKLEKKSKNIEVSKILIGITLFISLASICFGIFTYITEKKEVKNLKKEIQIIEKNEAIKINN